MSWFPNADGILWFYDSVWRSLKKRHPGFVFDVVGSDPSVRLGRLRSEPGVNLAGYVEDVTPYLAGATVAVVPLRVGSGLRIKVLEFLSCGIPVVTTSVGCEGIPVTSGRELVIADGAEAFGEAVSLLLGDPAERQKLSENAVRFVREHYSFESAARFYEEMFS